MQYAVRVRHVIAVPGWDIESQPDDSLLIANEHNIAMLTGWKNEREYLMDEDLTVLVDHLDGLCSRPV